MSKWAPSLTRMAVFGIWASCAFTLQIATAQEKAVTVHIRIQDGTLAKKEKAAPIPDASDVVIWLKPIDQVATQAGTVGSPAKRPQVVQHNKSFHPHLTVVRVGTMVDFPNHDPFFHNVFSLVDGKRFDLGLYEAGVTNSVKFDHVGVSYLFCNIHPEMSAVVVAVDSPYYGVSDKAGTVTIANVPDGKYEVHVWYEQSVAETLKGLTRGVQISEGSRDLGTLTVARDPSFTPAHKNKYGQDYAPPPKQGYSQP